MRMAGRLVRPRRFCYGNIISRLHACAIRIFWNRYVSERNICIVGRLAVSFSVKETASSPVPSSFTEYSPWEAPMEAPAQWYLSTSSTQLKRACLFS